MRIGKALALAALIGAGGTGAARASSVPAPFVLPHEAQGRPVAEIQVVVTGARRTEPTAVIRLMTTRVGVPLDPATVERDLARLRATQILYDTSARVEMTGGGPRLVIELRDRWTAFVFAGIRRGGARTITRVGVSDGNVLGRLVQVVAEVNSGADIPFVPRSSADRLGHSAHLTLPRPWGWRVTPTLSWLREFFDFAEWDRDGRPQLIYDRNRHLLRLGARSDLTNQVALGIVTSLFHDRFRLNSASRRQGAVPPSGLTASAGLDLQIGHVTEWLSRYEGGQVSLAVEGARRGLAGSDHTFVLASAAGRWFAVPRPRHNLGLQALVTATSARSDSHLPRAGGLYEIRGFLDATFLAQRIARANAEYRVEILETRWPAHSILQVVGFADGGVVSGRADAVAGLNYEGPVASAGAGLRINIVPLARAIGRVDLAVALHPVRRLDLAFGVQQFF